MTLTQIEYFIAVATHLSFTRAAREMFATQSAISRQITALEEELGFPLLLRTNKYVRLTAAGAVFLEKCQIGLEYIHQGVQTATDIHAGYNGSIRIGCIDAVDTSLFMDKTLRHFHETHPNISFTVERNNFTSLKNKIKNNQLDIMYTMAFDVLNEPEILTNVILRPSLILLMSRNHPLAGRNDISLPDFVHDCFFTLSSHSTSDQPLGLSRAFNYYNMTRTHRQYVDNLESVLLNVRLGLGVAIVDDSLRDIHDPTFYYVPLDVRWNIDHLSVVIAWHKSNLNPSLPLFVNMHL